MSSDAIRIAEPARKRNIPDEDMRHAVRNAIRTVERPDDMLMFIGPDRHGAFLEVGVVGVETDQPVILHAMPLRPAFHRFL